MQVRVLLPLASMGVEHGARAPSEGLAPDGAIKIIQALCPTAHERAQHTRRVLVKGRAEHRRDRQDDMPLDAPRLEGLAHLAHQLSTWTLAQRKHSADLQLIATRWAPWPHRRQRYAT